MSLRKNTLNRIYRDARRANKLGTIDPNTRLDDLGEAIRKIVRMKERERIPIITLNKMKRAQEKRVRKSKKRYYDMLVPCTNIIIPTEGCDESSIKENEIKDAEIN